jgi:prepilin-type N-terminal cleavage/methylation domain-containing protein|uniref:type II secretion system protein n=1 Tax=Cephaloticoccus sp. TaxID=1985742 RepID=UPI00404A7228
MKMRTSHSGFTLIEIMVVVTLIGILAGMARLSVLRFNLRTSCVAFNNDCRVFSEAFQRYSLEKGGFPADQTMVGSLPNGMTGYITERLWLRPTPIGGTYDWDNKDATNSTGATFDAVIKVSGCTWPVASLGQLDRWFDDGNLSSGSIIAMDAGTTVLFLIEAGAGG